MCMSSSDFELITDAIEIKRIGIILIIFDLQICLYSALHCGADAGTGSKMSKVAEDAVT